MTDVSAGDYTVRAKLDNIRRLIRREASAVKAQTTKLEADSAPKTIITFFLLMASHNLPPRIEPGILTIEETDTKNPA